MDNSGLSEGQHQEPWQVGAEAWTGLLENPVMGLPMTGLHSLLEKVDLALRQISETHMQLSQQKLSCPDCFILANQSDIREAATSLNDSAIKITTHSRTMVHHLSESIQNFSDAYKHFVDTGLALAAVSKDADMQSNMIGGLRSVSMVSNQLLQATKSVSTEPNSLSAKKVLPQAARAVIESTNEVINICTKSPSDQRVFDCAPRQKRRGRPRLCSSIAQHSWEPHGSRRHGGFSSQYREFVKKRQNQSKLHYNLAKGYIVQDNDMGADPDYQPHEAQTIGESFNSQQTSFSSTKFGNESKDLKQDILDCEQKCVEFAMSNSRTEKKTSEAGDSKSQCKVKVGSKKFSAETNLQSTLTERDIPVSSNNQRLQLSKSLPICKATPRVNLYQTKSQSRSKSKRKGREAVKPKVRFNEVVETLDLKNNRGSEKIKDRSGETKLVGRKCLRNALLVDALEKRPISDYQIKRDKDHNICDNKRCIESETKNKDKSVYNVQDSKKFSFCADELHLHLSRSKTNTMRDSEVHVQPKNNYNAREKNESPADKRNLHLKRSRTNTEAQQKNKYNAIEKNENPAESKAVETSTDMKGMLAEKEDCQTRTEHSHGNGQKMGCSDLKKHLTMGESKQTGRTSNSMINHTKTKSQKGEPVSLEGDQDALLMEFKPEIEMRIDKSFKSVKKENIDTTREEIQDTEIETLDLLDEILRKDLAENTRESIAVSRKEVTQIDGTQKNSKAIQPNLSELNTDCAPGMTDLEMSLYWDKEIDKFLNSNADHFILQKNIDTELPKPDNSSLSTGTADSDNLELNRKAVLDSPREKLDLQPPVLQPFDGPDMQRVPEKMMATNVKTADSKKHGESKSQLRMKPYWEMKLAINNKFDREKKLFAVAKRFLGENYGKEVQEKRKSHKPRSKTSDEQVPNQKKRNIFTALDASSGDTIACAGVKNETDSKTFFESDRKTRHSFEVPSADTKLTGRSRDKNIPADIDTNLKDDQTKRLCMTNKDSRFEKYPSLELVDIMKSFVNVKSGQAAVETETVDKTLGTNKLKRVKLLRKTRMQTLGPKTWKSLHCTQKSSSKRKVGRPSKKSIMSRTTPQNKMEMKKTAQPLCQATSLRENLKTIPNRTVELCSDSDISSDEDICKDIEENIKLDARLFNQKGTDEMLDACEKSGPYVKHKSCVGRQQGQSEGHVCGYCREVKDSKVSLQVHVEENHPYRCYKCWSLFPNKESSSTHFWTHLKTVYRCELCEKNFMYQALRDRHLRSKGHVMRELEKEQERAAVVEAELEAELKMALTGIMEVESAETVTSDPALTVEDACNTSHENTASTSQYLVAPLDSCNLTSRNLPSKDNSSSLQEQLDVDMISTDLALDNPLLGRQDNPILTLELLEPEILDPYLMPQSSMTHDQVWPQEFPDKLGDSAPSDMDIIMLDDDGMDKKADDCENVLEIIVPEDEQTSDTDILCRIASSFSLFDTFRDA